MNTTTRGQSSPITVVTVTIVNMRDCGCAEPWTATFSTRKKADAFKKKAERIIIESDKADLFTVTIDSGEIDSEEYLELLAADLHNETEEGGV